MNKDLFRENAIENLKIKKNTDEFLRLWEGVVFKKPTVIGPKNPFVFWGAKRVPLIMQQQNRECGAACLSMICGYYGKWVSLEQTRVDCGVSRNGVSAGHIVDAARSYGFLAKGYALEPEKLKKDITMPCIIHWGMKHFVVLCGFNGKNAIINDPTAGRLIVSPEEFDKKFTGIVIEIVPGESFVTSGHKRSILGFAKERLSGKKILAVLIIAAMIINSFFGFLDPLLSGFFIDSILTGESPDLFLPFIWFVSALAIVQLLVSLFQTLYRLKAESGMALSGSTSFVKKLLSVPYEFYSFRQAGDLLARKNANTTISMTLLSTIAPLFINGVMMVFFLTVMIRASLLLTAIGLFTVAINLYMSRIIANMRVDYSRRMLSDSGNLSSTTLEGIDLIETIRSSGAEEGFFNMWAGYQAVRNNGRADYLKEDAPLSVLPSFLMEASNYLVMIMGVYLTMKGSFSLGLMTAFLGYLAAFMSPANTLISAGETLTKTGADIERIEDVMEYRDDAVLSSEPAPQKPLTGKIEVRDLSFGYSKLEEPVVKGISFDIAPGQWTAIVGHSGCGKSTTLSLLTGLYKADSGSVLYDGKPLTDMKDVAVVEQDIVFFSDTIKNNLTLWDDDISMDVIKKAAKDACIDELIMERGGYEAKLLDAAGFSGGERQRLDIARALCHEPKILILDEATSAMDAATEQRVLSAIRSRGITCIIVSHRISAVKSCEKILVMAEGQIVGQGTHDELFETNKLYRELVTNE